MDQENGQYILQELRQIEEFISQNWEDPFGRQYVLWLQQTQATVKQAEQAREQCRQSREEIKALCHEILEDPGNDPEKILKKVR